MKAESHGVKFHPDDWKVIKATAKKMGITPGAFVNLACQQLIERSGGKWQGAGGWGGNRSKPDQLDLERADTALLGLPPLADDD